MCDTKEMIDEFRVRVSQILTEVAAEFNKERDFSGFSL